MPDQGWEDGDGNMHINEVACGGQKRILDPLELKLQAPNVVSGNQTKSRAKSMKSLLLLCVHKVTLSNYGNGIFLNKALREACAIVCA